MPDLFYLHGKPIYKLSMGNLYIKKNHPLLGKLRENEWLVIDGVAFNNQGPFFKSGLQVGDYVYACVGSKQLWGIYRITGDWQPIPSELTNLLPSSSNWGYRAAELVVEPVREDIWNLKHVKKHWAPSGFSTFYQVADLAKANQLLFEPYFDTTLIAGSPDEDTDDDPSQSPVPRNQILYGPPGTGKTYHTVAHTVALLEDVDEHSLQASLLEQVGDDPVKQRKELRRRYEQYRLDGRVTLVTFHQAFTYEDFIEGIKPLPPDESGNVCYDVVDGVFKLMCHRARQAPSSVGYVPAIPSGVGFDDCFDALLADLRHQLQLHGQAELKTPNSRTLSIYEISDNMIWYRHSDGVNHQMTRRGMREYFNQYVDIDAERLGKLDDGGSNAKKSFLARMLQLKQQAQDLAAMPRQPTRNTTSAGKAAHQPYVLIIDEINRGNVANIFGELITLIESDKRAGQPEALTVQLPYSKQDFSVPSNLFLLGTMNTADRSVEALDTALRRRFSFTEMAPAPELLPTDVEGINLQELLRAINARLEQLLDHDHCIGHALLMRVTTLTELREAFRRNILPLLQEYFFGDWGKMGLVLGGAFIQPVNKKQNAGGYKLMPFDKYNTGELSEKAVYKLANVLTLEAKSFQDIYA
ncbi:MAG TPA: AAA family ATPase [Hymenobacter sp.]|jgi:hypothetical protein